MISSPDFECIAEFQKRKNVIALIFGRNNQFKPLLRLNPKGRSTFSFSRFLCHQAVSSLPNIFPTISDKVIFLFKLKKETNRFTKPKTMIL